MKKSDPLLRALPHIRHGFYGRRGGVSTGVYSSLNTGCGSGDIPSHIQANRARVAADLELPPAHLLSVHQHHSAVVCVIDDALLRDNPHSQGRLNIQADGMVTELPNVGLGILTADCAPVLLATQNDCPVIGAIHAGWKGAIGGVLEAGLEAMRCLGAPQADIIAAIGPCIQQSSYEVGAEFYTRFTDDDADNERFFIPAARAQHWMFDLAGYVASRLRTAGVATLSDCAIDTYAEKERYFSYRRAYLYTEKDYGRQISAIRGCSMC